MQFTQFIKRMADTHNSTTQSGSERKINDDDDDDGAGKQASKETEEVEEKTRRSSIGVFAVNFVCIVVALLIVIDC